MNDELEQYTNADHGYHIHVSTVLDLSRRMGQIFESSEPEEKHAILNFVLQNPTFSGKKLDFTLKKPFETVLSLARAQKESRALDPACPTWLRLVDSFRTVNWGQTIRELVPLLDYLRLTPPPVPCTISQH